MDIQLEEQKKLEDQKIVDEINKAKKEFLTDGYTMSIGEVMSMYQEGELIIDPDFQRIFRWSITQQARFIESILVGIPLPSIFVYQNEDGKWEVVDGVQRLSTIFSFTEKLKGAERQPLEETKHLPCLKGMTWEKLPPAVRLDFKRARLEVMIIKHLSYTNAKFEVFQRLNTSSALSGQEYRNALMAMMSKDFHKWVLELAKDRDFQSCINLTDKWLAEKYDEELVLRFFTFPLYSFGKGKVDEFLNDVVFYNEDCLLTKISQGVFSLEAEKDKFLRTFALLKAVKGDKVFQKSGGRGQQFLESHYEAIAIGLYQNIDDYEQGNEQDERHIKDKVDKIEDQESFTAFKGGGISADRRIKNLLPFGKKYFAKKATLTDERTQNA